MRRPNAAHLIAPLLLAVVLGCSSPVSELETSAGAAPAVSAAPSTTTTTAPTTTTTTIDAAALAAFYDAITTTTTAPPPPTTRYVPPTTRSAPPTTRVYVAGSGGCAVPAYICQRESGGSPTAVNPTGCGGRGCYGKYQFDPITWNNAARMAGRPDLVGVLPSNVSEADQDQVAAALWAGGAGCSHWAAC